MSKQFRKRSKQGGGGGQSQAPPHATSSGGPTPSLPPESQYEVVAARRDASKAQVWQVPLLGVTIQAFLLTIALSPQYELWARIVASLLALTTAAACAQLLARHRRFETADAHWLTRYERMRAKDGWLDISDREFPLRVTSLSTSTADQLMLPKGAPLPRPRWWNPVDHSSYRLWLWILVLFAVVAAAAFVTVLRQHQNQPAVPGATPRSGTPAVPVPPPTGNGAPGTALPATEGR